MTSNQKMITTLVVAWVLLCGWLGYWFLNYGNSSNPMNTVSYTVQTANGTSTGAIKANGETAIAYISNTAGVVVIERASQSSLATPNYLIQAGDTIKSDTTGTAEIIFTDSSLIRLSPASILTLTSANEVRLDTGWVWARILKPLRDSSAFTIKTDDLSAAVRGTAVKVTKTGSGSEAAVIDSSETVWAVEIEANTSSGVIREVLAAEESLIILEKEPKKLKLNMQRILANEENRKFLKQDLVYLEILKNEKLAPTPIRSIPEWMKPRMQPISDDQYQKIDREILASLPSPQELPQFFDSNAIKNEAIQLSGDVLVAGSGGLNPEEKSKLLIELVQDDMNLGQLKQQLQEQREKTFTGNDPAAKEAFQKQVNDLESSVRNFDSEWSQKNRDRIKKRQESENMDQAWSGSQVEMPVMPTEPTQPYEIPGTQPVVQPIEKPKPPVPSIPRTAIPPLADKPVEPTPVVKPPIAPTTTNPVVKPPITGDIMPPSTLIKPQPQLSGSAQPITTN
jgi:FecR protein